MTIVTLTGPTCAGKTTVEAALQKRGFGRAISHTTRAPRALEMNGGAYHFVTDEEFNRLNSAGEFIETVRFGSAQYAMSASALKAAQAESKHVAIVVDPEGQEQIQHFCKQHDMPYKSVWIDCDPRDQARRWLDRMTSDMIIGPTAISTYADRLALMLSEEVKWRRQAEYMTRYKINLSSSVSPPEQLAQIIENCL